jgi:choline dehydrogenase-like flavoprotein
MKRVTIVGSGASGVHFALSLLRKGYTVQMVDAGYTGTAPLAPDSRIPDLKRELADPVEYFLGEELSGLTLPGGEGEYYGFPPQKQYVFRHPDGVATRTRGFEPLSSFAAGGLAQAWTAGVFPFNEADLEDFPLSYDELAPYYGEVAERIGVSGMADDLERFMPVHEHMMEPLELDGHSRALLERYESNREVLNTRYGCYVGRARVATLSHAQGDREACGYLGRCMWGCPTESLYTPSLTLRECEQYKGFEYLPDRYVQAFELDEARRVRSLLVRSPDGGELEPLPVDTLALAAGTLSSARIYLASMWRHDGGCEDLDGLMDNRQVLVPFVHVGRIGVPYEPRAYQYHQLLLGLETGPLREYVHGQITTLTTAEAHPILQSMPLDLRTATFVFRNVRAALGLVNLNFHDHRRPDCRVGLSTEGHEADPVLEVRYEPEPGEGKRLKGAVKRLRRVLRRLGCVVAPGAVHTRPMGASVHYAGTLPMSVRPEPRTVSPLCRSHDFDNLYVVDGSTFPFLPAKNVTFTLMANAARVADRAF